MVHLRSSSRGVVILGGGYAGMVAAARLARRDGGGAQVTLVDARPHFHQRIRFHETLAGAAPATLPFAPALARRGVRFVQGRVESLDAALARVAGRTAEGAPFELGYDHLVLALGSRTRAAVPGVAEHALRLDDPATLREAAGRLARLAAAGGRVLVAGGGLTGIEAATEVAARFPGLRVALATAGRLGDGYAPRAELHFRARLEELGVELREGAVVREVDADRAWLEGGESLPSDLVVWCGGFEAPPLAREAGLPTDACGRVRVDSALRVPGHPGVWAAGDAAVAEGPAGPLRMGCVSALPLGAHAGTNVRRALRGEEPEPFGMAFALRCVSLGRRDGLVQFTAGDDAPRERVWTRRPAALVKETICRMTMNVVRGELRTGLPLYRWPRPGRAAGAGALVLEGAR
ncbi:MAG TPA: FAD-dependent oxidoreductase [Longimicrobiaceae bacterium]